jgi:hypothetical protein
MALRLKKAHVTIRPLYGSPIQVLKGNFMSFRLKSLFSYIVLGVIFFAAGIACDKFSNNPSGVSNSQVVATVNGHDITFGDWMKQVDMTRVFVTPIDPSNVDQVKAVLNSLIDQQLVLDAAQKDHYSDPKFDDAIKKKLLEADLTVKEVRDRLEKDQQTLNRLEKNYQEPYKRMLLAHEYAASRLDNVVVTEKDLKDWYTTYSAQAARSGQALPPYEKVKDRVRKQVQPNVQREKFVMNLEGEGKINRNDDVISKYLSTLSASEEMLDSTNKGMSVNDLKKPGDAKDGGKK